MVGKPARHGPFPGPLGATMQTYQSPRPDARPFATGPYGLGDSQPAPMVLPARCLWAENDSGSCEIAVHHRRKRKTGPEFAVLVLRCRTHRRAFTLYPLGQVPYGRAAVAPVSCDGELLGSDDDDDDGVSGPRPGWQTTVFLAALQAASGQAWPRQSDGIARSWDTQQELLAKSAQVLGLLPNTPPRLGEQIAQHLQVPRLAQLDAARAFEGACGYEQRGRAVVAVLDRLRPGRCLLEQLLACGVLAGLWGPVQRWGPGAGTGTSPVFREVGTRLA